MENQRKVQNLVFRDHYHALDNPEKKVVRDSWVREACSSECTFFMKLRNGSFNFIDLKFLNDAVNSVGSL